MRPHRPASNAPHYQATCQSGISLYTLLAAVVVLGILTSAIVTNFNGTNTKGKALYALSVNVGDAATRFHLDTLCYPDDPEGLFDYSHGRVYNSCGERIPQSDWQGPYIKKMPVTAAGGLKVPSFGANARVDFQGRSVRVRRVPERIALAAVEACGGEGSRCDTSGIDVVDFIYEYDTY